MVISSFISDSLKDERVFVEARRIAANAAKIAGSVVRETYRSNCNVTLTAMHRLKPSSCKKPCAYVRPRRGAMNPHTARTMIAPTIAPMKPAFSPA
jgi:hypothetical protein